MQLLGTRFCYRNYLLEHYLLGSAATTDQHVPQSSLSYQIPGLVILLCHALQIFLLCPEKASIVYDRIVDTRQVQNCICFSVRLLRYFHCDAMRTGVSCTPHRVRPALCYTLLVLEYR